MGLTPSELARRRIVWHAAADLFLDTETRWEIPRIAEALCASRYGEAELQAIFQWELVPECAWNLYAVAGEWAVMPLDEARLARRAERAPSWLARQWLKVLAPTFLRDQWRAVLVLRARLAALAESKRKCLARVWGALAHAYCEERLDDLFTLDTQITALRESGLSRARCESALSDELLPIYQKLLVAGERATAAAHRACAEELIARAFQADDATRR